MTVCIGHWSLVDVNGGKDEYPCFWVRAVYRFGKCLVPISTEACDLIYAALEGPDLDENWWFEFLNSTSLDSQWQEYYTDWWAAHVLSKAA